jgi:hypothetical protein
MDILTEVFHAPTMIAVGIDPEKGLFHALVKTHKGQRRWSEPLSPMLQAVFAAMRSMLSAS